MVRLNATLTAVLLATTLATTAQTTPPAPTTTTNGKPATSTTPTGKPVTTPPPATRTAPTPAPAGRPAATSVPASKPAATTPPATRPAATVGRPAPTPPPAGNTATAPTTQTSTKPGTSIPSSQTSVPVSPKTLAERRLNGKPLTAAQMKAANITIFHPVKALKFPTDVSGSLAAFTAAQADAMKSWNPLTNVPALGGPALFMNTNGSGTLMARAADGYYYTATFDPKNPGGPIGGADWYKTNIHGSTDASCQMKYPGISTFAALCGYLGDDHQVMLFWTSGTDYEAPTATGGYGVGVPTIRSYPEKFSGAPISGYSLDITEIHTVYAWAGANKNWRDKVNTDTNTWFNLSPQGGGTPLPPKVVNWLPPAQQGWKQLSDDYASPIGCASDDPNGDDGLCAAYSGQGVKYFLPTRFDATSMAPFKSSPPLPGGAPVFNVAPVMLRTGSGAFISVATNALGRLYHRTQTGAWVDEGGAAKSGSAIVCLVNNEEPTCFIQGPDGRLYWKKFATAGGF